MGVTSLRFQSTLPAWGATVHFGPGGTLQPGFNPRSPRGERQWLFDALRGLFAFQSTLPAWGATPSGAVVMPEQLVSIHAPRVGSDLSCTVEWTIGHFVSIHAPRVGSDGA